jgi:hypothetical protein
MDCSTLRESTGASRMKPAAYSPRQAPQATNPAYAAFFAARIFAHLARSAAAIFLRAAADMVRLAGVALVAFATAAAG